jgi:hypothetical protein
MIEHNAAYHEDFEARHPGETCPDCKEWEVEEEGLISYKIIRFRFEGARKIIQVGLSLEEAQAHCRREDTHGDGWFDGYEEET